MTPSRHISPSPRQRDRQVRAGAAVTDGVISQVNEDFDAFYPRTPPGNRYARPCTVMRTMQEGHGRVSGAHWAAQHCADGSSYSLGGIK
jgi:hypothetical protein